MNGLFSAVISEPWQVITLKCAIFGKKSVSREPCDDVIMTSFNRACPYSYMNNPTKFGGIHIGSVDRNQHPTWQMSMYFLQKDASIDLSKLNFRIKIVWEM